MKLKDLTEGTSVFYKPYGRVVVITHLEYDEKSRFTKVYFDDSNYTTEEGTTGSKDSWSFPDNFIKIS